MLRPLPLKRLADRPLRFGVDQIKPDWVLLEEPLHAVHGLDELVEFETDSQEIDQRQCRW